ncbi:MAG: prolyl oligopeptidase family serine peptidase [Jatrophihabitans sp.]|uniref:S9 family peptidase n=1 Tax=Jatrophihabitans sp. TaxID=1932789 RepID=UPI0039155CE7
MAGFDSFDDYLALPRVTDLVLSPDGARLVATVAALNDDGNKLISALWELDPSGVEPARRLTRSDKGETGPALGPDGSVLFVSGRDAEDDDPPALWQLPPVGEAQRVLSRPGGVAAVHVARESGAVLFASKALPGAVDPEADEKRRSARKEAKVGAVLYTSSPIRYWDHDLGPDEVRLQTVAAVHEDPDVVDLTPAPGRALDETSAAITPDGTTVITGWQVYDEPGFPRAKLVAIDVTTGGQRVLADQPDASFAEPAVSDDGRFVVCVREQDTTYDDPPKVSLWLVDLQTGDGRELAADPDVWPASPAFAPGRETIYFLADEHGHRPVFRLDLASGAVSRVTASGHYSNLQVAPDGSTLFALRDAVDCPPRPVRLDASATDGEATELPAPGTTDATGRVERVTATAADGATVEGWLALPDGASADAPAPLVLWIHGGPLGSWNGWSWRWNPWLMVAKGYAVLLPDPALSVGYGAAMIQRGWGQWGGAPFTDLMTMTDAVVDRPDIDETRTAAMGGSYGGYMANWVAGHTDRFRCIVTHASLWALDQFQGTTDVPGYWVKEWGLLGERPERYDEWSPHHALKSITTPMLVIHGDKDYRVPVSEALRLWWDLQRQGVESAYLYYPDEGHWILKPGNARVWYETVWAWLAQHVHSADWRQPELL